MAHACMVVSPSWYCREHSQITKPASSCFESALVCDWAKHPYVQGAYCGLAVGGHRNRYRLTKPVYDGRMVFAGEHTHRIYPSSVQAAIESGQRAASHVAKVANKLAKGQSSAGCSIQ